MFISITLQEKQTSSLGEQGYITRAIFYTILSRKKNIDLREKILSICYIVETKSLYENLKKHVSYCYSESLRVWFIIIVSD